MTMRPWFEPKFSGDEEDWTQYVLDSGFINDGLITTEFEQAVARIHGYPYGVAVTSGTAALALTLMALGINNPDQEVIVPDLTFIATANAVRLAGANVVLCDVDPDTMCLSAETVGRVVSRRTAAIIAVEVNGRRPDYEVLDHWGVQIIVDGCESMGSDRINRFARAYCLSFSPNKLITTGQGGMVLTDDTWLERRLRELKDQGRARRGTGGGQDQHPALGFNFKFTDLQAGVGMAQLGQLEDRIEMVRQRNDTYREMLKGIVLLPQENGLQLWFDILPVYRDDVARELRSHDWDVREFWQPLHTQGPYRTTTEFPNASRLASRGLWLPSAFGLTSFHIQAIVEHIKRVAVCPTS